MTIHLDLDMSDSQWHLLNFNLSNHEDGIVYFLSIEEKKKSANHFHRGHTIGDNQFFWRQKRISLKGAVVNRACHTINKSLLKFNPSWIRKVPSGVLWVLVQYSRTEWIYQRWHLRFRDGLIICINNNLYKIYV